MFQDMLAMSNNAGGGKIADITQLECLSVATVGSTTLTFNTTLEPNSIYAVGLRAISSQGAFVVGTKYDATKATGVSGFLGSEQDILVTDKTGNISVAFMYGGYATTVTKNSSSFVITTNNVYTNHSYGLFKLV